MYSGTCGKCSSILTQSANRRAGNEQEKNYYVWRLLGAEPIQRLEDAEAGKLFKAILQFANDGIKADFPGAVGVAYSFITSQISATR